MQRTCAPLLTSARYFCTVLGLGPGKISKVQNSNQMVPASQPLTCSLKLQYSHTVYFQSYRGKNMKHKMIFRHCNVEFYVDIRDRPLLSPREQMSLITTKHDSAPWTCRRDAYHIKLSMELREISWCQEKAPSRTFCL